MSGSKRRPNPPLGDWIVRSPSDNTPEGMLRAPPGSPGAQNIPVPTMPTQGGRVWSDSPNNWSALRTPTLPQGAPHAPSSQTERPWNFQHYTAYRPGDMAAMQGAPPGTLWLQQQAQQMQAQPMLVSQITPQKGSWQWALKPNGDETYSLMQSTPDSDQWTENQMVAQDMGIEEALRVLKYFRSRY